MTTPDTRDQILHAAEHLINGPRAKTYGTPNKNFTNIAALWAPILGTTITPAQVALCLTQLKIARLINHPTHEDSWVDAAGYIALGAEVAERNTP